MNRSWPASLVGRQQADPQRLASDRLSHPTRIYLRSLLVSFRLVMSLQAQPLAACQGLVQRLSRLVSESHQSAGLLHSLFHAAELQMASISQHRQQVAQLRFPSLGAELQMCKARPPLRAARPQSGAACLHWVQQSTSAAARLQRQCCDVRLLDNVACRPIHQEAWCCQPAKLLLPRVRPISCKGCGRQAGRLQPSPICWDQAH